MWLGVRLLLGHHGGGATQPPLPLLRGAGAEVVRVQKGAQADEGVLLRAGLRARRGAVGPCALSECKGQCVGRVGLGWGAVVGGCGGGLWAPAAPCTEGASPPAEARGG